MFTYIPENGPLKSNNEKYKHLDDGIFEIRNTTRFGPKLRVFTFEDERTVVCVDAFLKRGEDLKNKIKAAQKIRDQYKVDKVLEKLEIIPLEEFSNEQ